MILKQNKIEEKGKGTPGFLTFKQWNKGSVYTFVTLEKISKWWVLTCTSYIGGHDGYSYIEFPVIFRQRLLWLCLELERNNFYYQQQ